MKNKYVYHARISELEFRQVLKLFATDLTSSQSTKLVSLNHNTVDRFYNLFRERIADYCLQGYPEEIKSAMPNVVSESPKSRRVARGAKNKAIIFGIFIHDNKIFTEMVSSSKAPAMQKAILGEESLDTLSQSEDWRGYNGLIDIGSKKCVIVSQGSKFALEANDHDTINAFCAFATQRLIKFKGIPHDRFAFYLKETEYRFNYRTLDLYKSLLEMFKHKPII
ncbi:MAG: hypothetical protein FWH42_01735 [Dehalococcoidia bacterium]|nr:hypothetical protein [Dehalococcoidia bacterium]